MNAEEATKLSEQNNLDSIRLNNDLMSKLYSTIRKSCERGYYTAHVNFKDLDSEELEDLTRCAAHLIHQGYRARFSLDSLIIRWGRMYE